MRQFERFRLTGSTVPRTFEMCATATSRVRALIIRATSLRSNFAGVVHRSHFERSARLLAQHLPGNDIRMMFQLGDRILSPGFRFLRRRFARPG